jgi:hypothetical protein
MTFALLLTWVEIQKEPNGVRPLSVVSNPEIYLNYTYSDAVCKVYGQAHV